MWTNVCLFQVQDRLSKAKTIQMVIRQKEGSQISANTFFKPKKLFSTALFSDDAFSALAHDVDGISCFCWLKLLNPIGSLNPIKRFIFSDVLFKFFNYVFWILLTISIPIAKPFTPSLLVPGNDMCTGRSTQLLQVNVYCYKHITHNDPKLPSVYCMHNRYIDRCLMSIPYIIPSFISSKIKTITQALNSKISVSILRIV